MAKKSSSAWTLARLGGTIERGFSAVANDIAAVRKEMATKEEVAAIRKEMATKEEVAAMRKEMATKQDVAGILTELRDIKDRLKVVEDAVGEHGKYSREIDYAFERIATIEKHLGIKHSARRS